MQYQIRVSRTAKSDANLAYEWTKENYSDALAVRWFNGLVDAVNSLMTFPKRCPIATESEELGMVLHQLLYGKGSAQYRIIFSVLESESMVKVYSIWHGARDKIESIDLDFDPIV